MLCSPLMGTVEGSSRDPRDRAGDPGKDEQPESDDERQSCPKCGSQDVRRSNSEGVMPALLRALGRWPFRCRSCRARFYRASPPEDA